MPSTRPAIEIQYQQRTHYQEISEGINPVLEKLVTIKDEMREIRTDYDGPSRISSLTFSGRTVRIVLPEDPDQLLTDPAVLALNRLDDYMPYWAYLWPGAYLLADCVARKEWRPDTRALEIGCGLGLAGLLGVASGLWVDFTDYDETPLRFVERSLRENAFAEEAARTFRLDWRTPGETTYPVILGADVLYEKKLLPLVCDLIRKLLEPDGEAWIAGPYRVATEGLEACLESRGLISTCDHVTIEVPEQGAFRGTLHRIRHRRVEKIAHL
jgi:predicted nicotinamide N-methyase